MVRASASVGSSTEPRLGEGEQLAPPRRGGSPARCGARAGDERDRHRKRAPTTPAVAAIRRRRRRRVASEVIAAAKASSSSDSAARVALPPDRVLAERRAGPQQVVRPALAPPQVRAAWRSWSRSWAASASWVCQRTSRGQAREQRLVHDLDSVARPLLQTPRPRRLERGQQPRVDERPQHRRGRFALANRQTPRAARPRRAPPASPAPSPGCGRARARSAAARARSRSSVASACCASAPPTPPIRSYASRVSSRRSRSRSSHSRDTANASSGSAPRSASTSPTISSTIDSLSKPIQPPRRRLGQRPPQLLCRPAARAASDR